MSYEEILKKVIDKILEKMMPEKIILFGSRVRNRSKKNSDTDLAVLGGKDLSFREMRKFKEEIEEISGIYSFDIVIMEKLQEEFKNMILKEGIVLYEKK
ncbi:MAG: nucleotidyltransferase domain-containing protein [Thermoanaerobaculia bacterium]